MYSEPHTSMMAEYDSGLTSKTAALVTSSDPKMFRSIVSTLSDTRTLAPVSIVHSSPRVPSEERSSMLCKAPEPCMVRAPLTPSSTTRDVSASSVPEPLCAPLRV